MTTRMSRTRWTAGVALAAALLAGGPTALAQPPAAPPPAALPPFGPGSVTPSTPGPPPGPDPTASARNRLRGVPEVAAIVTGRVDAAREVEAKAKAALDEAETTVAQRRAERQALLEKLAVLGAELIDARRDQTTHATSLVQLLQGSLMGLADGTQFLAIEPGAAAQAQYNTELSETAAAHVQALLRRDAARISRLEREQGHARDALRRAESDIDAAEKVAAAAAGVHRDAVTTRERSEAFLKKVADEREYPGLKIDLIVLDAYLRGARITAEADAACGIEWWALAAIGQIESSHAGGRTINANGDVVEPILGPVLDGSDETQRIADTDKGALDGDTEFDRAVGPMQFTPETWRVLGVDGNADRVVNPANLYDATASAARKLCRDRDGKRLDTATGYARALISYNQSDKYVTHVMQVARDIQKSDLLESRAVSIFSGPLPTPSAAALVTALRDRGRAPEYVIAGPAWATYNALQRGQLDRPPIVAGRVVVFADAAWSQNEQLAILRSLVREGLPTLWLPAPDTAVSDALRAAAGTGGSVVFGPALALPRCAKGTSCDELVPGAHALADQLIELLAPRPPAGQTPVR